IKLIIKQITWTAIYLILAMKPFPFVKGKKKKKKNNQKVIQTIKVLKKT
ncbi:hypothetical protein, partial [Plasmodium yoelii yoelii]